MKGLNKKTESIEQTFEVSNIEIKACHYIYQLEKLQTEVKENLKGNSEFIQNRIIALMNEIL